MFQVVRKTDTKAQLDTDYIENCKMPPISDWA